MVEPLANLVKGSFGRATPAFVAAAKRTSFTSNFFTPVPRQPPYPSESSQSGNILQCKDWSCCNARHSLTCSNRNHGWDLGFEVDTSRKRRRSNRTTRSPPELKQASTEGLASWSGQRRHASMAAQAIPKSPPPHPPSPPPTTPSSPSMEGLGGVKQFDEAASSSGRAMVQAWNDYESRASDIWSSIQLWRFAGSLLCGVEELVGSRKGKMNADQMQTWISRIQIVLDRAGQVNSRKGEILVARFKAVSGDNTELLKIIRANRGNCHEADWNLYAWAFIHPPTEETWKELLEEIASEGPDVTSVFQRKKRPRHIDFLLRRIEEATEFITNPTEAILSVKTREQRQNMFYLALRGFVNHRSLQKTSDLVVAANQYSLQIPRDLFLEVFYSFLKAKDFFKCSKFVELYAGEDAGFFKLKILSNEGKTAEAENLFANEPSVREDYGSLQSLLFSYTHAKDTDGVVSCFNRLFPKDERGWRESLPKSQHYFAVMLALTQDPRGHEHDIDQWIQEVHALPMSFPNIHTVILEYYTKHDKLPEVLSYIKRLETGQIQGDVKLYTTLMAYFARRKKVKLVESLYTLMKSQRIRPDAAVCSALMNAHVEAGSWSGVMKTYQYFRPILKEDNIVIRNTLLKAYLHLGAPFSYIRKEFVDIIRTMKPNQYTFNIATEAACDVGDMHAAISFYKICLRRHIKKPSWKLLTPTMFNLLIVGFNRSGRFDEANNMYEEMLRQGFTPDSYTYAAIIRGITVRTKTGGPRKAEEFIEQLLAQDNQKWKAITRGKTTWFEQLYAPLFHHYRKTSVPDVERLFKSIVDRGAKPTLYMLLTLMDAYRKSFNWEGVFKVWPELFRVGMEHIHAGDEHLTRASVLAARHGLDSTLCAPLSVYISACSRAGQHAEVFRVWKEFQEHRLKFDLRNWNDLGVALVRAGEPERAFSVLENVIIKNQVEAHKRVPWIKPEKSKKSPLLYHRPSHGTTTESVAASNTLQRSSLWGSKVRRRTMGCSGRYMHHVLSWKRLRQLPPNRKVSPLRILARYSLRWNVWKPHFTLMQALLQVTVKLKQGFSIRALQLGERRSPALVFPANTKSAHATLQSIMTSYPNAFKAVVAYSMYEKRRLGRRYYWVYERTM